MRCKKEEAEEEVTDQCDEAIGMEWESVEMILRLNPKRWRFGLLGTFLKSDCFFRRKVISFPIILRVNCSHLPKVCYNI